MEMVTHYVTEAEVQEHVFVTLAQPVIIQYADVYVPKAVKVVQLTVHQVQVLFAVL